MFIGKCIKFEKNICMPAALKQELIDKISAIEDENLLQLLKEDYDYFTGMEKLISQESFLLKTSLT